MALTMCVCVCLCVCVCVCVFVRERELGAVSEWRLSENSEYVNPEMRETLGFPFQNGGFVKPGKAG